MRLALLRSSWGTTWQHANDAVRISVPRCPLLVEPRPRKLASWAPGLQGGTACGPAVRTGFNSPQLPTSAQLPSIR